MPANGPGRLTAIGSVRARYWNEALEIFSDHPLLGVGAEGYETARLRYRTAILNVGQAHGFVVQTLADLGLAGLLVVLALLGAWLTAAGRATHPFNRRWSGWRWHASPISHRPGTERPSTRSSTGGGKPRERSSTPPSASGCSRWCASSRRSASTRSWTGRGTSPASPAPPCCAPGGSPAAGR